MPFRGQLVQQKWQVRGLASLRPLLLLLLLMMMMMLVIIFSIVIAVALDGWFLQQLRCQEPCPINGPEEQNGMAFARWDR